LEIKSYGRKRPDVVLHLKDIGVLTKFPVQQVAQIEYDDGIDIHYYLKNLTPSRFAEVADFLLLAASTECKRYEDQGRYFFASFDVKLNRTAKGKSQLGPIRTYTAAKHKDYDTMIYGEESLGYTIPEGMKKPFLNEKVRDILGIPDSPSPGAYVTKQKPYVVVRMTVSIRAGLNKAYLE